MDTVDSKVFGSVSETGDFVGRYVVDVKTAIIVAMLADVHLMLIGEPGSGKTSISKSTLEVMLDGKSKFKRFSPTTEPESITGVPHPRLIYEEGRYEYNTEDTISDPKYLGLVLDELQRLNDAGLELMMQRLDRDGMPDDYHPVSIATVNWIPKGERMAALVDRFGMMALVPIEALNIREVATKMIVAKVNGRKNKKNPGKGIPDLETIMKVRSANPPPATIDLVAKFVEDFAKSAETGLIDSKGDTVARFHVNNRRLEFWTSIVLYASVYYSGREDFTTIPPEAKSALRWGWVSQDVNVLAQWTEFTASGTIDPVDAIVAVLMEQAFVKMDELYKANSSDKLKLSKEFGIFVNRKANELRDALREAGISDPDEDDHFLGAYQRLTSAFANVARGRSPLEDNID